MSIRNKRPRVAYGAIIALGIFLATAAAFFPPPAVNVASAFESTKPVLSIPIPGLKFSEVTEKTTGETRYIDIPYISDYISAVYRFGVGIASVIAAIMMMVGGFRWLTAGGDAGRVSAAKENIKNALVGLALSLGAYTILYTVNPDMLTLKGTQVEIVKQVIFTAEESFDEGDISSDSAATGGGPGCVDKVIICGNVSECTTLCNASKSTWPTCNSKTISASATEVIPESEGLQNPSDHRATQAMITGLARAGQLAHEKGYTIVIKSGFRPLERQIDIVCGKIKKGETSTLGASVAWPGGSNHGSGIAADLALKDGRGTEVVCSGCYAGQTAEAYREPSLIFAEIMEQAGFQRYSKEIWHFELPSSTSCRCRGRACPFPPTSC